QACRTRRSLRASCPRHSLRHRDGYASGLLRGLALVLEGSRARSCGGARYSGRLLLARTRRSQGCDQGVLLVSSGKGQRQGGQQGSCAFYDFSTDARPGAGHSKSRQRLLETASALDQQRIQLLIWLSYELRATSSTQITGESDVPTDIPVLLEPE